ncbi:MAG: MFS transporter [Leptospirales bacterium]
MKIKKEEFSWALYDWANSAFSTTIIAGFFPFFFKEFWNIGVADDVITLRLAIANSIAGLFIALLAPFLGAWADLSFGKKKFLTGFAFAGIFGSMALAFLDSGSWQWASFWYIIASLGFFGGNIFYDSFLPVIAKRENLDRASNLGYALGYLGGGLLLAANVLWATYPDKFGFSSAQSAVKGSFLSVGIWWALFSIPLLIFVKDKKQSSKQKPENYVERVTILQIFRELKKTVKDIMKTRTVLYFLIAYWLYIDGVHTIIRMAVIYGSSINLHTQDLITALIVTQFVGFPASLAYIKLSKYIGVKKSILAGISVYIFICIWGATIDSSAEFFVLAGIVGLVQGGVQALSRSYYTRIIPIEKAAEFFGFYNMLGKFAVIIGPMLMALTGYFAIRFLGDPELGTRISIVSITVLFLAGGLLLMKLPDPDQEMEK